MNVGDLRPDAANRRKHNDRNIGMLVDSLETVGAARSIVIDEDGVVLAGNGVLEAAAKVGLSKVQVIDADGESIVAVRRSGLSPEQKRALAIYDNRTAELAEWNVEQLKADAAAGLDLKPFFFDEELKDLFGEGTQAGRTDPDAAPTERATDIQVGDLFELGPHRLVCGDCSDRETVRRVMGHDMAALVFTSPPYAEQRKDQYGGIPEAEYVSWFGRVQAAIRPTVAPTGHFLVNIKAHAADKQRSLYVFDLIAWMVRSAGWLLVDEFVWLRTGIPQQVINRFKNAFEPVYWFANTAEFVWHPEAVRHESDDVPIALGPGAGDTNAAKRQGKGGGAIQGNKVAPGLAYPSNVLDFKQNAEAIGHPAAFPVALPAFFVRCMTKVGEVVLDPFCGSGTTLIACESNGRSGRGIELRPGYCQMTIDRWEAFTGNRAVKVGEAVHA